jgi:hypothetical protein
MKSLSKVLLALLIIAVASMGCSKKETPTAPQGSEQELMMSASHPLMQAAIAVQDKNTPKLMTDRNVIGTAATLGDDGKPAIMILVLDEATKAAMPATIDGINTKVIVTDRIVAMNTEAVNHKTKQTPPIQLGTSGGWRYDLANGYCCGGTLGSLIQVGTQKRILSNYHVFESDIVSGGNGRVATTGDPIIQPGLIDVSCNAANAQNVATLVKTSSLPGSNVDCSSATIVTGMVNTTGAILEIGTISKTTIAASVNQAVKKSGRTTGLTRSKVSGLNATISVSYENECAGGTAFTKTFTGQILVTNRASKFLGAGDSGSLMVQDVTTNPKAIGLLFAGSTTLAVANPINSVLSFLGATMVGN